MTVFDQEQLDRQNIFSTKDLATFTPSLTANTRYGSDFASFAIRGFTQESRTTTSVGVDFADAVVPRSSPLAAAGDGAGPGMLFDLQSVQVLKGPQGTLFGRNATGGAVLYTTAKPTNDTAGMFRARLGNLDLREFEGMVNTPIVADKVLFRAAFNSLRRDGYIDNIVTGDTYGELYRDSGRLTLTVNPTERLENTTMYSYARIKGTNTGASYVYSVYTPADEVKYGRTLNTSTSFMAGDVQRQRELGYYKTQHPYDANHVAQDDLFINTTTFDISDELRLKNIFGYTASDADSEQPSIGAAFPSFVTRNLVNGKIGNELEVESWSDELQLSGSALDGGLNYIAGLYLQKQRTDTLWPQTYFGATSATSNWRTDIDTTALYAQATYSLTSQLRATGGVRYTYEDVTIKQLSYSDYYNLPGFAQKQKETFEEPSWEIGLEYDLNDSTLTYLKTRHSFRSGGFNGSAQPLEADATGGGNKFDMERVQDVELGLKYEGLLLDRPTRLNLALYKQWVDDVQRIEFPDPPGPVASIAVTANIPEMVVQGVELEASMLVTDWFEFGISGTYTDADFTKGDTMLFGTKYSYGPVANTPEKTWSVWAQFGLLDDAQIGQITLRAEAYGQDSMYFSNTSATLTPDTELPSYELVNARLNWKGIMGTSLSGALFAKNLTDEEYFVGGMPLGASLGHNGAVVAEPRTYGAELSYEF